MVEIRIFFKSTSFTSSTFPIQPDFSRIQPAAITLNTGSLHTLRNVRLLVTNEPVKFEKSLVQVQDFKIITRCFKETCRIFSKLIKEN